MSPSSKDNRRRPAAATSCYPIPHGVYAMTRTASLPCTEVGVGIDTHRYFHQAEFLYGDVQPAAPGLNFEESVEGYAQLRQALEKIEARHPDVHFRIHVDAA